MQFFKIDITEYSINKNENLVIKVCHNFEWKFNLILLLLFKTNVNLTYYDEVKIKFISLKLILKKSFVINHFINISFS